MLGAGIAQHLQENGIAGDSACPATMGSDDDRGEARRVLISISARGAGVVNRDSMKLAC